jgi:hypothetical protein
MRRDAFVCLSLVLTTVLAGCEKPVKLLYVSDEHKVVLHPDQGTVLTWAASNGSAVGVTFPFGNPCKENPVTGQCTINVAKARVPYDCTGCADPEIIVGSDISIGKSPMGTPATTAPPTATVYMGCNSNQVAIYPAEVSIPTTTVAAGATVLWVPGGLTPIGTDWTVNGFTVTSCSNNPPFNSGNNTCSLNTNASSTTYTVSSASCNNSSTSGRITITP